MELASLSSSLRRLGLIGTALAIAMVAARFASGAGAMPAPKQWPGTMTDREGQGSARRVWESMAGEQGREDRMSARWQDDPAEWMLAQQGPRAASGDQDADRAKAKPQTPGTRPFLPPDARMERDLEYVEGGHARNKLDLYLPAKADRRLPVIVWIHGGAWWAGSKENCMAAAFVERGYAVASINYRLSQHALFPAQIEDCKAAIRWLRAHADQYGLDGRHIGVWGASAGGHLAALLGTSGEVRELEGKGGNLDQSSRVQCVVDFFGPTDVTQMGGRHDEGNSPEAKLLGGPVQHNKDKAAKANPITYVSQDDPPFLIMHGEEDRVVPINQSELLDAALRRSGVECTFVRIPGNGHGGPGFVSPENRRRIEEFFAKHLK